MEIMVLFGGRSFEHEVSLLSAQGVIENLSGCGYDIFPVGITEQGEWVSTKDASLKPAEVIERGELNVLLTLNPLKRGVYLMKRGMMGEPFFRPVDMVFPLIHGPFGEDGTLQGLLEIADIPYTGSGVTGSSIGMDKGIMKRVFQANNIPQTEFLVIRRSDWEMGRERVIRMLEDKIEYPYFVKPCNSGSSVGITKVHDAKGLAKGLETAFSYDIKAVVERAVKGREIECSVLGNEVVTASLPGEIIPCREFYDYEAKYILPDSKLVIPAQLSKDVTENVRELAIRTFKAIEGRGYARVDFFFDEKRNEILVNEINTIPGWTTISMFPKLWEASGISYRELLCKIIDLGFEEFERKRGLKRKMEQTWYPSIDEVEGDG